MEEDDEASPFEIKLMKSVKAFTKKLKSIKLKTTLAEEE